MATYLQLSKITKALGGVIVICGYPIPTLTDIPDKTTDEAKLTVSYSGSDMRWMVISGDYDWIFPAEQTQTMYKDIFAKLEISEVFKAGVTEW